MTDLLNSEWIEVLWVVFVIAILLSAWAISNSKDWFRQMKGVSKDRSRDAKKIKKEKICWVCHKSFPKSEKFKWLDFNYGNEVIDTKNQRCCLKCYNKIEQVKNAAKFKKTDNLNDLKHICDFCIREDHVVKQSTNHLRGNYKIKTGELVLGNWNVCDDCYRKYKPGEDGIIPNRPNYKATMNLFGILKNNPK